MDKNVIVIPPEDKEKRRIRAAVYCRVSNKHEDLENSLENQISHYRKAVGEDPRYELTEIYYDFGISGYKESRPGFQKMMADAETGKFEIIITKAITRFARNTDTVLKATRRLKELGIGVFFELQGINTLSQEGELLMTLYAAFGQAESEGARMHKLMSIKRRYENGKPPQQLHRCLGYCKNADGEFVPDKNAPLVIEMFEMAADGFTVGQITNYLNAEGIKTQNGKNYCRTGVTRILRNAAYKGDFICQRYYVDENRRLVLNKGEKQMYYIEEDHIPIVTRQLWDAVQQALDAATRRVEPTNSKPLPLNDENYPYRNKLFCAKCGHRLSRAVRAGRVLWECNGKGRFSQEFCSGVIITDDEIREAWPFEEKQYISAREDRGRITGFDFIPESEWSICHKKKIHHAAVPELSEENYPYMNRIFCKYCGSRLRRIISNAGKVTWICDNSSRLGKAYCKGIRVPDEKLHPLRELTIDAYIGKEKKDGKESYGYSRKPDKREKQ